MAAYERVTLNRGGRNSRFDCTLYFFYAEKALASLYIFTGSPESSSWN